MKSYVRTALFCISAVMVGIIISLPQKSPSTGHNGKFGCAVDCMDGRVQDVVKQYIQKHYDVEFVDAVTEAGPNKILAENTETAIIKDIEARVNISVHHHKSKIIAIVGHHGCAGNPTGKENQIEHLRASKKRLEALGITEEIILLWVCEDFKSVEKID